MIAGAAISNLPVPNMPFVVHIYQGTAGPGRNRPKQMGENASIFFNACV